MDPNFYNPVHRHTDLFLQAAAHVTELRMTGFEISQDYVRSISNISSLYTVMLYQCSPTSELRASALQVDFPKCEQVLDLSVIMDKRTPENDHTEAWYLLPLFPRLRTLAISDINSKMGMVLPPEELLRVINFFQTLEKFSIHGLVGWQVTELGNWIRSASRNEDPAIRITHFSLRTKWTFNEAEIATLANALSYGPDLEVCIFDGVRSELATTVLIDLVARFLPNVLGLTIQVKDDERFPKSGWRAWPSAMWQYGSHFTSFSRLQYFGWNNRFEAEILPNQMVFLEEGYPDEGDWNQWKLLKQADDDSFLHDIERTGAVFAAYCPSLKYFVQVQDNYPSYVCLVEENAGSRVVIGHWSGDIALQEHDLKKWNTSMILDSWSPVIP